MFTLGETDNRRWFSWFALWTGRPKVRPRGLVCVVLLPWSCPRDILGPYTLFTDSLSWWSFPFISCLCAATPALTFTLWRHLLVLRCSSRWRHCPALHHITWRTRLVCAVWIQSQFTCCAQVDTVTMLLTLSDPSRWTVQVKSQRSASRKGLSHLGGQNDHACYIC